MTAEPQPPNPAAPPVRVTAILPALNEEAAVDATFAAIAEQTRPPDEIIVADGGSTDQTVPRIEALAARGVPVRVVANPGRYPGAGRNAATEAARGELIVTLDFGNRADPGYIEAMVRAFDEPDTDLTGGAMLPRLDGPFEQACAGVIYHDQCLIPSLKRDDLLARVPRDYAPGGLCTAYRKAIWSKAGGYPDALACGEDKLFGLRVRRAGGRITPVPEAILHHHMAHSARELFRRHYRYARCDARIGLDRATFRKLSLIYGLGSAMIVASAFYPPLWALVVLAVAAYLWRSAVGRARRAARAVGRPFAAQAWLWAPVVRLVHDLAVVLGNLRGYLDLLARPQWRAQTRRYLETGRQYDITETAV